MKHQILKIQNLECPDKNNVTNIFSYMLGALKIKIYSEYRGEKVDEYKNFVYIKVFGFTVLHWIYRDKYLRDFYPYKIKNK